MHTEHIVTLKYHERQYRKGERQVVVTLVGTIEQIADHVRETTLTALSYGSGVSSFEVIPTHPVNVIKLEDRS